MPGVMYAHTCIKRQYQYSHDGLMMCCNVARKQGAHQHGVIEPEVHHRVRQLVHKNALLEVGGAVQAQHVLLSAAAHGLPLHPPKASLLICTTAPLQLTSCHSIKLQTAVYAGVTAPVQSYHKF